MEWQDIETRRNLSDTTGPFLAYFPGHGVEVVRQEFSGLETIVFNGRRLPLFQPEWVGCRVSPTNPPTHWMPLPEPPHA